MFESVEFGSAFLDFSEAPVSSPRPQQERCLWATVMWPLVFVSLLSATAVGAAPQLLGEALASHGVTSGPLILQGHRSHLHDLGSWPQIPQLRPATIVDSDGAEIRAGGELGGSLALYRVRDEVFTLLVDGGLGHTRRWPGVHYRCRSR